MNSSWKQRPGLSTGVDIVWEVSRNQQFFSGEKKTPMRIKKQQRSTVAWSSKISFNTLETRTMYSVDFSWHPPPPPPRFSLLMLVGEPRAGHLHPSRGQSCTYIRLMSSPASVQAAGWRLCSDSGPQERCQPFLLSMAEGKKDPGPRNSMYKGPEARRVRASCYGSCIRCKGEQGTRGAGAF